MTYRAQFQQPREHPNPLSVTITAVVTIELHPIGRKPVRWRARYLGADDRPGQPLLWESKAKIETPDLATIKAQVQRLFEQQLTPWTQELSEARMT